jgi:HK97 family phage prohead protease
MPNNLEMKFATLDLKTITDEGEFEGYASKFEDRDQGGDKVMKGAFTKSLTRQSSRGIKMLWQHDPSLPIGNWDVVEEDELGLKVKGKLLLAVQKAQEVHHLMKAGIIDGLSIGYRTIRAAKDAVDGSRKLIELDLWEISVVTFPMLPSATVSSVKNGWSKRTTERVLRDAGMPNAMAVKLIAGGWDAANSGGQGDPDDGIDELAETIRQMNETLRRRLT